MAVREVNIAQAFRSANFQVAALSTVKEHFDYHVREAHLTQRPADAPALGGARALLEEGLELGDQHVGRRGLGDVIDNAELEGALRGGALLPPRVDDPRHVLAPRLPARLGEQGKTVAGAQVNLAHDGIGLALGEDAKGLLGRAGRLHREALLAHAKLEHGRLFG